MGNGKSKASQGGMIVGAHPQATVPVDPSSLPPSTPRERRLEAIVPSSVRGLTTGSQKLDVIVDEVMHSVTMPEGLQSGERFSFTIQVTPEMEVYTSTLPSLPGMETIFVKPIVHGSVSVGKYKTSTKRAATQVGDLIKEVTDVIRYEAIKASCNAILGVTYNVTNDSTGDHNIVVVTATGTPCVVIPKASSPSTETPGGFSVMGTPVTTAQVCCP